MKHHALIFSSRQFSLDRSSGAHRIATFLREHDWDVEVVDFAPHLPLDKVKQLMAQRVTDRTVFFGFSVFINYWNNNMNEILSHCKEKYPLVKTIMGGTNVTFTKANKKHVDYWIDSYGEYAVLELVKSLVGNSQVKFSNIGDVKLIKGLELYPAWNMQSLRVIMEPRDFVKPFEWLTIEFSRGCKFACAYCNYPILGVKHDNSRDKHDFEYEMKYNYDNFGTTRYWVTDETFNDREEKMIKFGDVVQNLDFNTWFSGYIRADLAIAKPETLELIARCNFGGHYYGVETFNHESGKIIGKGMHPDKVKQGILDIKQYMTNKLEFYRGNLSFIIGLPKDTENQWLETVDWLHENWKDESVLAFNLTLNDLVQNKNGEINLTNASKFSRDLVKYGISEMTTEEAAPYSSNMSIGNPSRSFYPNEFFWKHDTMNYFEARKLCDDVWDTFLKDFRLNAHHNVCMPDYQHGQKMPFSYIKDQTLRTPLPSKEQTMLMLNEYIDAKLNWEPK